MNFYRTFSHSKYESNRYVRGTLIGLIGGNSVKLFPPLRTSVKGSDAQNVALLKIQTRAEAPTIFSSRIYRNIFHRKWYGTKDIGAYLVQGDPYIDWLARCQSCSPFKWHVMVFQLVNRLAPFWSTFCQLKVEVIVGSCFEGLGAVCIGLVS